MLTAFQIDALQNQADKLVDPIVEFLIKDIAKRISQAGQLTGTAAYQVWTAQRLGLSQRKLKKELQKLLKVSQKEIEMLLTQAAETGYNFDISKHPTTHAIPLAANSSLQQILDATVKQATEELYNITQTIGFVGPDGACRGLTEAYNHACDFAFQKVTTGAQDYISAVRDATRNLAKKGIQTIDYESGVHTSMEAAVRRNIMGGLGIMQEQISQQNHDALGCDGWELSAHAGSAPDHEPYQGKQYTDAEYTKLNNRLVRRIGTLNCGHAAFPIILGVNSPQYTPEELEKLRDDNETGVEFEGKHYTLYEATQKQRKYERTIRYRKREILIDETLGDKDKLQADQIKLIRLKEEYKRFSKGVGLPMQYERMEKAGFNWKKGKAAEKEVARLYEERQFARASDYFSVLPPIKGDAIKPQSIYKELHKSDVGMHAFEYIVKNKIPVEVNYTDEVKPGTRGVTIGRSILIYAKNTKTIRLTTETIIHEATHIELASRKKTQWEEAYCFAQEAKHTKKQLTFTDLKSIIKTVKKLYPEYPWR